MYGFQEALYRERCADSQRRLARRCEGRQHVESRRSRRRAEQARRASSSAAARSDYELAGR